MGYPEPDRYVDIELPRNSALGPLLGAVGFLLAFGLVWRIWWLAALCCVAIVGILAGRGFQRRTVRIISAGDIQRAHQAWLETVRRTDPVTRDRENTPANRGRAVLETGEPPT